MNDKEFCIECVKRISRPTRTKLERQMVQIVEQRIKINPRDMFTDNGLEHLFNGMSDLQKFVYCYIRDNQDLF